MSFDFSLFEAYDRLFSEDQKKNMLVEGVGSSNLKYVTSDIVLSA